MQEPPLLNPCGLVDYTTGGESHPALKCICLYFSEKGILCQAIFRRNLKSSEKAEEGKEKRKTVAPTGKIRYNQDMEYITRSREETIAVAKEFAASLKGGDVVLLSGELGAGKTTFTKGIALALGVTEPVTSPTFTIIKEYDGAPLRLYHMDMYRLSGDLAELGLEEYLGKEDGICVIEWCAVEISNTRVFEISLGYEGENCRKIVISEPRNR